MPACAERTTSSSPSGSPTPLLTCHQRRIRLTPSHGKISLHPPSTLISNHDFPGSSKTRSSMFPPGNGGLTLNPPSFFSGTVNIVLPNPRPPSPRPSAPPVVPHTPAYSSAIPTSTFPSPPR